MTHEYDIDSAITFFMVGLGIGSVLAILFNPKERFRMEGSREIRSWAGGGLQGQMRAGRRVA
jgi:hypothetical protein